jgi:hypothetical protein
MVKSLVTLTNCLEYVPATESGCGANFSAREAASSSAVTEALLQRIQETMAEETGGTAATEVGPSTFLNPAAPAEPTPELGEGEQLGLEESAAPEEVAPEEPAPEAGPSSAQRALLDYLLGP